MIKPKFDSYEDFYETMTRGNEVQFLYKAQLYFCLAWFESHRLVGCLIGPAYSDGEVVLLSELADYRIQGKRFRDVFDEFEIIDRAL